MQQLAFDFMQQNSYHEEDYIVSPANQQTYQYIKSWPNWNHHCTLITGEAGSGKTHLSTIWKLRANAGIITSFNLEQCYNIIQEHNAILIEDIDRTIKHNQQMLLHIYNLTKEHNKHLLLTSSKNLKTELSLPDLISRLSITPHLTFNFPDENFLQILLYKQLSDYQLQIHNRTINYIIKHMRHSFSEVKRITKDINYLVEHKRCNFSNIKNIIN